MSAGDVSEHGDTYMFFGEVIMYMAISFPCAVNPLALFFM